MANPLRQTQRKIEFSSPKALLSYARALEECPSSVVVWRWKIEGKNLYTEFLETRGEGIHHLAYQVEDMETMKTLFTEKVGEPVFYRDMGIMEFAYFDTSEVGGLMIEFLHFKNGEQRA